MYKKDLNYRADGRIEWMCKHGVGHTVSVPKRWSEGGASWTHGCCGCCSGKVAEYMNKFGD